MNEALMDILTQALTAAEEARAAAQEGRFDEAYQLLAIMDDRLEAGQGGNAAHAARRKKILRVEAEARALLPSPQEPAPEAQPVAEPAQTEAAVEEPDTAPQPTPVEEAAAGPAQEAAPEAEAQPRKERGVAAPHHLTAQAWALVQTALLAQGADANALDALAGQHRVAQAKAETARDSFGARVAERFGLQATLEAAAIRGDVEAANAAWDRLFDVVTAIRSREGQARRRGLPDAAEKAAIYDAARLDALKIKRWARGMEGPEAA